MKIFKHILAFLLFFPITIFFVLYVFSSNLFQLFNTFHYENFKNVELPIELTNIYQVGTTQFQFIKIFAIIYQTFSDIFKQLKEIFNYKF